MNHDTTDTIPERPAWLNLHAVIPEKTCAELAELGDRIEAAIADLAPVLERCYRAQREFGDAAGGLEEEAWNVTHRHSGAERLSDLLYLLAAHVHGAAGEDVDVFHDVPWLRRARSELGLDEWNVRINPDD